MVQELIPKRQPLFGKGRAPAQKEKQAIQGMLAAKQAPHQVPVQAQAPAAKPPLFSNKKILAAVALIFVAAVVIVVLLLFGLGYDNASIEKSSVVLPFLLKRRN